MSHPVQCPAAGSSWKKIYRQNVGKKPLNQNDVGIEDLTFNRTSFQCIKLLKNKTRHLNLKKNQHFEYCFLNLNCLRESPTSHPCQSQCTGSLWAGQWQKVRHSTHTQTQIFLTSYLDAFPKIPQHFPPRCWPVPVGKRTHFKKEKMVTLVCIP